MLNQAKKYIRNDVRTIADGIHKRDGGVLRNLLVSTIVNNAVTKYELDEVDQAKLLRYAVNIVNARLGGKPIKKEEAVIRERELPEGWQDIIVERQKLSSLKQLSKLEVELHKEYCSETCCRFTKNYLCPVAKGWLKPNGK